MPRQVESAANISASFGSSRGSLVAANPRLLGTEKRLACSWVKMEADSGMWAAGRRTEIHLSLVGWLNPYAGLLGLPRPVQTLCGNEEKGILIICTTAEDASAVSAAAIFAFYLPQTLSEPLETVIELLALAGRPRHPLLASPRARAAALARRAHHDEQARADVRAKAREVAAEEWAA